MQIRAIDERRDYLSELDERREAILGQIGEQGKLTPELEAALAARRTKAELEDLYLPYKPKRRTRRDDRARARARAARGADPSQQQAIATRDARPRRSSTRRRRCRTWRRRSRARATSAPSVVARRGDVARARGLPARGRGERRSWSGQSEEGAEVRDYYDTSSSRSRRSRRIASWRSARRGRGRAARSTSGRTRQSCRRSRRDGRGSARRRRRRARRSLADGDGTLGRGRRRSAARESTCVGELKQRADARRIDVFARQPARTCCSRAPLGARRVDRDRSGAAHRLKVAVVDAHRQAARHRRRSITFEPRATCAGAQARRSARWSRQHGVERSPSATARRPRDRALRRGTLALLPRRRSRRKVVGQRGGRVRLLGVATSRARSSRTSTSRCAARSRSRGACRIRWPSWSRSIPRAIGVGPVPARRAPAAADEEARRGGRELRERGRRRAQHRVARRCSRTSRASARRSRRTIVAHRDENGRVPHAAASCSRCRGLGPKAFEQAAGFLRIRDGGEPARRLARCTPSATRRRAHGEGPRRRRSRELVGNAAAAAAHRPGEVRRRATSACPRCKDILAELEKPGRDPRADVRAAEVPRRRAEARGPEAGHGARGRGHQRHARSARSSTSACTRTASCTSRSSPTAS